MGERRWWVCAKGTSPGHGTERYGPTLFGALGGENKQLLSSVKMENQMESRTLSNIM